MEHRKRLLIGGGMATLLTVGAAVGALTFGPALAQSPSANGGQQPGMTAAEAEAIALAAYPGASVVETDFDQEEGAWLYSIDLDNGLEVSIDPQTRAIMDAQPADADDDEVVEEVEETDEDSIEEEVEDDADDAENASAEDDKDGAEPDQDTLAVDAALSTAEAEAIALAEHPGARVVESDLDDEDGALVFSVELDNGMEVKVDATTGAILATESDDDED